MVLLDFRATVVVNLTIYYTNIRSGFIRLDPSLHGTYFNLCSNKTTKVVRILG